MLTYSARAGPTFVSGTLTANTTWTIPGSPYIVFDDLTVPVGITLTIEPGTDVRFQTTPSAHSIIVFGTIISVGQPNLRVTFTSDAAFPDRNDWTSIRLQGSVGSVFEWTDFAWGSTTLDIRQCSPRIANNSILESGRSAIQVIGPNAAPLIENNAIHTQLFNQRTGIVMQESDAVVRNNVLTDNYFGIYVYLGEPRIENNTIRNGWRGVWIVGADPLLVNNTIEGNGLPSIGGEGLLMTFASPILRDNVIQNNGVGVDIPYDSKGALPLSRGNVVNGIPLETLYRVGERDLEIEGVELDSGRGSGFTGNATLQGLLTCYDCVNVTVSHARLRNNDALIFAANSSITVMNSTLTNSSDQFHLSSVSQIVSLNNEFSMSAVNFTDQRSTLTVKNFLHVRTLTEISVPIPETVVRVFQDGAEIRRSTTDDDGWSRWNVAIYGVLARLEETQGPPTLTRPVVEVAVNHPTYAFRETPRVVNMSRTHTETFLQTDQVRPEVTDTIPAADSVGVRFGSRITITFSEPMNRTATEAAILVLNHRVSDFQWTPDGRSVSFAIADPQFGTTYFVEVQDSATDLAGNRLGTTYLFAFDIEHAPRRVDLVPIWGVSVVILAIGLLAVFWRSRSRAKALREEDGNRNEKGEA